MKIGKFVSLVLMTAMFFSAFSPAFAQSPMEEMAEKNIVEVASADGRFNTLVAAVQAAGLVDTLSGTGPFTVFAPTDAAFNKLGKATIDALLANPDALKNILLYHVLAEEKSASDVLMMSSAETAAKLPVVFKVQGNQVFINNARIILTDVPASNGVIHVLDTVILPPDKDIVDTAVANPQFKTLVAAVQAAGLVDTLKGEGPFTVFAPTDAAFNKLGKATIDALLADPEALKGILLYHAVEGKSYASDVVKVDRVKTINGAEVTVTIRNGQVYLNDARVVTTDILTTNGVIHVLDTVILPPQ